MRKHNFINGFKAHNKQDDKVAFEARLGKLTIFKLNVDISQGSFAIMLFNLGYETSR